MGWYRKWISNKLLWNKYLAVFHRPGFMWFRVCGIGLAIEDQRIKPQYIRKVMLGGWLIGNYIVKAIK